jgi:tRNA-dihydrouridine synthase B
MVNGSPLDSKRRREFIQRLRGTRLMLPPLAGYTDHPYRRVLAGFSPPFICTEMVSPHAVIHGNPKVMRSLELVEGAHMSGVQLVGDDPVAMAEAAAIVESIGYDYVDINMGCTVGAVTRSGAGVSLMRSPEKAIRVAGAAAEAVDIPVTCKMRLGASSGSVNAAQLSLGLAEAGVSAIAVHGRSGEKKFGLPVDYEGIRAVVEAVDVPVVANGGIFTGGDAVAMVERTGAAAVMPGRGLIGNPWLINEILLAFDGEPYAPPSLAERKNVCLDHLHHLRGFYGEEKGVIAMRRVLHKYFSGCSRVNLLKLEAQRVTSLVEVQAILDRVHEDGPYMFFSET